MPRIAELDPSGWLPTQSDLDRLLTPCLLVHLDRVRGNVARVLELLGGDPDRWRPHVKTTKIPEVWAELTAAGVRQFKCATTREADVLGEALAAQGVEGGDVLVAYPHVGPALTQLGKIAARHEGTRYSVLVEDAELLAAVPDTVEVFLDLNPGMNRTGVPMSDTARILELSALAGARFRGLHFYDGHQHEADLEARARAIHAGYDELLELRELILSSGTSVPELITSGTPALLHAVGYAPLAELEGTIHRVSPGTVVFHDQRSEEENPGLDLLPAATVLTRIVSHPTGGLATCDAGSKAVAAEAGDPVAAILGHPDWEATQPNEEHLPIRVPGELPPRGAELLLVPRHICPTVNLAERAVLLDGHELVGVVDVAARAHEVLLD
jgi:D-serine deaminase-like pyridoxal phosphate-dependent protein